MISPSLKWCVTLAALFFINRDALSLDEEAVRKMCIAAMAQTNRTSSFRDDAELEKTMVVTPELKKALEEVFDRGAWIDWKSIAHGKRDPVFIDEHMREFAKTWLRNIGKFVDGSKDWTAAEKAAVIHEMGKMISERVNVTGEGSTWRHEVYRTLDGSYAIVGPTHELIILNIPGSPFRNRRIGGRFSLMSQSERRKYYRSWDAAVEDGIDRIQ